jgi:hypothetical protein
MMPLLLLHMKLPLQLLLLLPDLQRLLLLLRSVVGGKNMRRAVRGGAIWTSVRRHTARHAAALRIARGEAMLLAVVHQLTLHHRLLRLMRA